MPLGTVRRRGVQNPGHSRLRQLMAPQPDAAQMAGFRPVDVMRRSNPMAARAVQRGGMPGQVKPKVLQAGPQLHSAMRRPRPPFPQRPMRPRPQVGRRDEYQQFSDISNPNRDAPLAGGFNDAQVQWMKRNLLGWDQTGPGEGRQFQRQLSEYIRDAGGMEAFQQMLGGMPGWNRQMGSPGAPRRNTGQPVAPYQLPAGAAQMSGREQMRPNLTPEEWAASTRGNGPDIGQWQQENQMFPNQNRQLAQQGPDRQALAQQEASRTYGPQGRMQQQVSPQGGIQRGPQAGGVRPVSPQGQRQAQGPGQRPDASRQVQPRAQSPQERGQNLVREPAARASARAYRGETDREAQKKQDRDFFAKRGIPLTPEVEEGMRELTDQYIQTMIDLGYAEADAAAAVQMEKQRLSEDFGNATMVPNESAAESGIFNSSVRGFDQDQVEQQFGRSFQDLALQAAQQQRGFTDARAAALEAMRQGRMDLSLMGTQQAVANAAAGNQYTGLPTGPRRGGKRSRRRSQQ